MVGDEAAVRDLIAAYSDALNHRDWASVRATFADGAIWRTVNFRDIAFQSGDGIVAGLRSIVDAMDLLVQVPGATTVQVTGDLATARSTVQEYGKYEGGSFACLGSYADQMRREGGRWHFIRREFTYFYWQEGSLTGEAFQVQPGA